MEFVWKSQEYISKMAYDPFIIPLPSTVSPTSFLPTQLKFHCHTQNTLRTLPCFILLTRLEHSGKSQHSCLNLHPAEPQGPNVTRGKYHIQGARCNLIAANPKQVLNAVLPYPLLMTLLPVSSRKQKQ